MDCPIIVLHATNPAAMFPESIAAISGSEKRAPAGMSFKLALGCSGGVGGNATPFAFNRLSISLISCCPPRMASSSNYCKSSSPA